MALSTTQWLLIGGGVVTIGALILLNKGSTGGVVGGALDKVYTPEGRAAFNTVIPTRSQQYADAILDTAQKYAMNPFTILALIERESASGTQLRGGTGDHGARWKSQKHLDAEYSFAKPMGLLTGRSVAPGVTVDGYKNTNSVTEYEISAPMAEGATVAGWGYGLCQIDYASFKSWIDNNDWNDPAVNINKGVTILRHAFDFFSEDHSGEDMTISGKQYPDPRPLDGMDLVKAGLAAYNSGETGTLHRLAQNLSADGGTTGADYGSSIINNSLALIDKFNAALADPTQVAGLATLNGGSIPGLEYI